MSDTTNHYICTDCKLPCDVFFAGWPPTSESLDPKNGKSMCCKANVDVVGAKD